MKKLHIDWWVMVVPAFPGRRDCPNVGMCRGLLSRNLILLQTTFGHLVIKQIHERRQLTKVGAATPNYLWALSVSIRDSLIKQIVMRGRQLTKVVLWASYLGSVDPSSTTFQALG